MDGGCDYLWRMRWKLNRKSGENSKTASDLGVYAEKQIVNL